MVAFVGGLTSTKRRYQRVNPVTSASVTTTRDAIATQHNAFWRNPSESFSAEGKQNTMWDANIRVDLCARYGTQLIL